MKSFYSIEELKKIGFKYLGGDDILVSRKASIYGAENMSIGNHVRIDDFCCLSGTITIGEYVHISSYVALYGGSAGIEICDFSGISSRCAVYAVSDDYSGKAMTNSTLPDEYRNVIYGKVTLEKHVQVGTGCTILPGVIIKEGTSVGSMSLIRESLEGWGIYAGIPCKRIKERKKDLLLLEKKLREKEISVSQRGKYGKDLLIDR